MMRSSRLGIVLAIGMCAVLAGSAGFVAYRRIRPVEIARLGPNTTTIVPGVHILCGLGPSAAYVVETPEGLVLVDTGLEADAGPLKAEMAKLGLDWKKVKAVLLTHAHGDHCGGAEYLRKTTGAKVYAGREDASPLNRGGPREAFFSTFYMPNHAPHPTEVDVPLDGDESIAFGDVKFRALAMPGHTPGSICYLMERDGLRVLFGGDVITMLAGDNNDHPTGRKPLGTYSAYLSPRYRGDVTTYLASLHKLRALPVPDLVLPGHPLSDPTPQSPRMDQARWDEMIDRGIKDMETLQARFKEDGADFLDGRPKQLLKGFYYFGDFERFAIYGFFAGSKFFLFDAPGGPGLHAFLQDRFKELQLTPAEPFAILLTSCNARDTAGLSEIVEKSHAKVIAPPSGVPAITAICPSGTTILPADDLHNRGWFDGTPLPLRGRGSHPLAYLLNWEGKKVLVSGRIPVLFDHNATEALTSDLAPSREDTIDYLLTINTLESLKPDVWLPAIPSNDQNANLYDTDWHYIIANNYRLGRSILDRPR